MPLTLRPLNETEYNQKRYDFVKQVEESGEVSLEPYLDIVGIPTMGLGFNMRTNLNPIMDELGIVRTRPAEQPYISRLRDIVAGTYTEDALREALDDVMNDRADDPAIPGEKRREFSFLDEDEVTSVFVAIAETYEAKVNDWQTQNQVPAIEESLERVALFSLAYNTKDGSRSLLGEGLAAAIQSDDRAEAWFEIRYNSNYNNSVGIEKRRYEEASLFGFYDGSTSPEEAQQVFRMLQLHRAKIELHEARLSVYNPAVDPGDFRRVIELANIDLEAASFTQRVGRITQELEVARQVFVGDLATRYQLDPTMFDTIEASRIFLDAGRVVVPGQTLAPVDPNRGAPLDSRLLSGTIETISNDLLVGDGGNDTLTAGFGDDVLIGGVGDDHGGRFW